ncbi:hypothetical protein HDU92_000325 [Lobulomyces angularis]|nr:hypothetical protein HDU92_000325 [Lobulomyces angularis]
MCEAIPRSILSEDILNSLEKIETLELPYTKLIKSHFKTKVLIGVSGCGKTATCFHLCRQRFGLYFDCFAHLDFQFMISTISEKVENTKTIANQIKFERVSQHYTNCLFLSRVLVFNSLKDLYSDLTAFDWLMYQLSSRTQEFFRDIYKKLIMILDLPISMEKLTKNFLVFFDEAQHLLSTLPSAYHSVRHLKSGEDFILDGAFKYPRSFFSFLAKHTLKIKTIWCGTQMSIKNMDLFLSAAGHKPSGIFSPNFHFL